MHSHVDIYNFTDNTWGGRFDMPKEMAHSHLGMVTDGRYIYVVTGQYGPQCRGPTAHTFVLDTKTKEWRDMPPLPVPRCVFYYDCIDKKICSAIGTCICLLMLNLTVNSSVHSPLPIKMNIFMKIKSRQYFFKFVLGTINVTVSCVYIMLRPDKIILYVHS